MTFHTAADYTPGRTEMVCATALTAATILGDYMCLGGTYMRSCVHAWLSQFASNQFSDACHHWLILAERMGILSFSLNASFCPQKGGFKAENRG